MLRSPSEGPHVAEENDNPRTRPAGARRAAKVDGRSTDGDDPGPSDPTADGDVGSADSPPPGRRARRRTPFWRKGRFWVAVILVEVALALVISFSFERSSSDVDLGGGDLAAFCTQVRTLQDQRAAATASGESATAVTDPSRFEEERDAYLALVPVAPPDLVPDLERLAELDDDLIVVVRDIAERKAEDPAYNGLTDLTDALDRAGAEGRVAAARLDVVLVDGCGIVPGAAPTSTAPAPIGPVVGTPPR